MLRISDCSVLSPQLDIYVTPSKAHGTLQEKGWEDCRSQSVEGGAVTLWIGHHKSRLTCLSNIKKHEGPSGDRWMKGTRVGEEEEGRW